MTSFASEVASDCFLNENSRERELRTFLFVCPLIRTPYPPIASHCVLKHWHLCLYSGVGRSARPLRWRSQQSCALRVNKTSAQLRDPRLSEHKSHQITAGLTKTSAAHANASCLRFSQQSCGLCARTQAEVFPSAYCTGVA